MPRSLPLPSLWTLALPALLLPAHLGAQSPMFRGDAAHTGVYAAPARPLEGRIAWSFEALDWDLYKVLEGMDGRPLIPTTPAVVDGGIYGCAGPYVFALDLEGKLRYRVRLGAISLASPAVASGVIYLPTDDGLLHALDARDGTSRWTCRVGTPSALGQLDPWDVYQASPALAGGNVYLGAADGSITAVGAATGKVVWRFRSGAFVRATPAVSGGRVYAGNGAGKVFCLDAATGRKLWEMDTRTPGVPWHTIQGSCAVSEGKVYVGSRSTFFYALDALTGRLLWKHGHGGSWVPSSPAVKDGVAYVGQSDGGKVTALGPEGAVRWIWRTDKATFASPALAGDTLFVATNDNYDQNGKGGLAALDLATGKARWTLDLPRSVWASPVVAGDAVYVACADGRLYAVK